MILDLPISRGFAFKPFIVIPKGMLGLTRLSYIEHERTHFNRQGFLPFLWLIKYFKNKAFRFIEEALAFRAEIAYKRKWKLPVDVERYATIMSREYNNMCSYDEAYEALTREKYER